MKHKRLWTRLFVGVVCSAMIFATPVASFAEGDTNAEDVAAIQEDEETEVLTTQEEGQSEGDSVNDEQEIDNAEAERESDGAVVDTIPQEEGMSETVSDSNVTGNVLEYNSTFPEIVPEANKTDGTQDVTFTVKNGLNSIKSLDSITLGEIYTLTYTSGFEYDVENGVITISADLVRDAYANGASYSRIYGESGNLTSVAFDFTLENGEEYFTGVGGYFLEYTGFRTGEDAPVLLDSYQEFDGTKDLTFQFKNGTGNNEITAINYVIFYGTSYNNPDAYNLNSFWIANYKTSFNYDLEKGEVTLFRHAVSAIVYDDTWTSAFNTYGHVCMQVEYADGTNGAVFARQNGVPEYPSDWQVKVLERSPDTNEQHVVELPDGQTSISKDDMQNLVDINKNADVIIKTASGVYYSFAKGTMHMVSGKEVYDVGAELITDFSQLTAMSRNTLPFTEEEFAFRINYNYSGELPGVAQITIPLDTKWAGQTLYYYEVMADNTYRYTGQSAVVANDGTYTITQDHCSDYVGLTKMLESSANNPEDGAGTNNNSNANNSNSGNITTTDNTASGQGTINNTKTSPQTGDTTSILPYVAGILSSLALVGGAFLRKYRK